MMSRRSFNMTLLADRLPCSEIEGTAGTSLRNDSSNALRSSNFMRSLEVVTDSTLRAASLARLHSNSAACSSSLICLSYAWRRGGSISLSNSHAGLVPTSVSNVSDEPGRSCVRPRVSDNRRTWSKRKSFWAMATRLAQAEREVQSAKVRAVEECFLSWGWWSLPSGKACPPLPSHESTDHPVCLERCPSQRSSTAHLLLAMLSPPRAGSLPLAFLES
mmetsp:Transcript_35984/g.94669  ORF Transcript_35984/g.94669 Transcript_35984/m.94669 type:complete len:218 (-) Transcript_35984:293-946(-)